MHKREWTQHQYRFEAVTIDEGNYFPHGAKFTYRKYACDKVVVIDKKPILSCRTPVGILTGEIIIITTSNQLELIMCKIILPYRLRTKDCTKSVVSTKRSLWERC